MSWFRGKEPASKPENPSSMPGSHMVEGENLVLVVSLTHPSPRFSCEYSNIMPVMFSSIFLLPSFSMWLLDPFYPEQSGCHLPSSRCLAMTPMWLDVCFKTRSAVLFLIYWRTNQGHGLWIVEVMPYFLVDSLMRVTTEVVSPLSFPTLHSTL